MKNLVSGRLSSWIARWALVAAVGLPAGLAAPAQTVPKPSTSLPTVISTGLLTRPVRFARAATVPLAQALAEVARQSGVPISYSSSRIGAGRRCALRAGAARPLGQVLAEMLGPNALSAGLVGGQLVLWPAAEKPPLGVAKLRPWAAIAATNSGPGTALPAQAQLAMGTRSAGREKSVSTAEKQATNRSLPPLLSPAARSFAANGRPKPAAATLPRASVLAASSSFSNLTKLPGATAAKRANTPRHSARETSANTLFTAKNKLRKTLFISSARRLTAEVELPEKPLVVSQSVLRNAPRETVSVASQNAVGSVPDSLFGRLVLATLPVGAAPETRPLATVAVPPAPARPSLRQRQAQASLLPPLSTNGLANARTVNVLSLNLLAGCAAGVRGVEIGGLLNVVRDSVRGGQAAGLLNVVGTDVRGVQLAGLGNMGGGGVRGLQAAGSFNVVRDDVRGVQLAGLLNVVGGAGQARVRPGQPTQVRRWLGLPRLLATDGLAQLPAAPSASQPGMLVQVAGLANLTGTDVRGVQTAPLFNVARRVYGAQFGLVNVVRRVRGVQFGIFNFADSVVGVPIGFVNIVRRGGYRRGEIWASESLPLNAVFKLGVPRFYTIFGAAAEPFGNRVAWAAGFGVGTAGRPHGRFTLSLDLLQWTLAGSTTDPDAAQVDSRLLTQLRPALAWQLEANGRLQLVVAPTFNLAVAWQNDGQPNWDFGSNQWLWIETAGSQSQTRLWPGLQVGLRF